jgi:hypothetical protein
MSRPIRWAALVPLLCLSPASAADEVMATPYSVVAPHGATADFAALCTGEAIRVTATVQVTCSVEAHDGRSATATCVSPTSRGACPVTLSEALLPAELCAEAVAYFRDLTTATDRECRTFEANAAG